jgi:hypothetical protein
LFSKRQGKTIFLLFILLLRILDGEPTIFRYRQGWLVGFSKEGAKMYKESWDDWSLYPEPPTWVLSDPDFAAEGDHLGAPSGLMNNRRMFAVFTTSPNIERWYKWEKQRAVVTIVIQPWS